MTFITDFIREICAWLLKLWRRMSRTFCFKHNTRNRGGMIASCITLRIIVLLGPFENQLRKAAENFFMSVRPSSVGLEQLHCHGRTCVKSYAGIFYSYSLDKSKFCLKSDKITDT
jgi:hypothetical protein